MVATTRQIDQHNDYNPVSRFLARSIRAEFMEGFREGLGTSDKDNIPSRTKEEIKK